MNTITVDEAINGYLVTIIWNNDRIIKEICETETEVYIIIAKWLKIKMEKKQ